MFSEKRTKAANDSYQTEEGAAASLASELQLKGRIDPDAAISAGSAPLPRPARPETESNELEAWK